MIVRPAGKHAHSLPAWAGKQPTFCINGKMIIPYPPRRGILISSPGREPGERLGTTLSLFLEPRRGD